MNGKVKVCLNAALVFCWWLCGVIVMMICQGERFITASYVVMQIVTTIGYGDVPVSHWMYWFFTIYVLVGIVIVANIINDFCDSLLDKRVDKLSASMRSLQHRVRGLESDDESEHDKAVSSAAFDLGAASLIFFVFVLFGVIFFALLESCSCSYGITSIAGCNASSYDVCVSTNGAAKSWADCVYMSVITLTTVGFGDVSPKSWWGRLIAVFWMLFGVLSSANLVEAIGTFIQKAFKESDKKTNNRLAFDDLDHAGTGRISKAQFLAWMLVKEGYAKRENISLFFNLFDKIDGNNDGKINYSTLKKHFHAEDDEEEMAMLG